MINNELNGIVRRLDNGHFVLTFSRKLHVAVDQAWSALLDDGERSCWFPSMDFIGKVDGAIRMDFGDEGTATGTVLSINEPSELAHTIVWEDMPTSEVTWSFMPDDDSDTTLVLSHQNITQGSIVDWAVGWHLILDDLAAFVEQKDIPDVDIDELVAYYSNQLAL